MQVSPVFVPLSIGDDCAFAHAPTEKTSPLAPDVCIVWLHKVFFAVTSSVRRRAFDIPNSSLFGKDTTSAEPDYPTVVVHDDFPSAKAEFSSMLYPLSPMPFSSCRSSNHIVPTAFEANPISTVSAPDVAWFICTE